MLERKMMVQYTWRRIDQASNVDLDEDYRLEVGNYTATVATRAEYTGWAIYKDGYSLDHQLAHGGYSPNIPESAWHEVCTDYSTWFDLDESVLESISEPMMAEAEAALKSIILTPIALAS